MRIMNRFTALTYCSIFLLTTICSLTAVVVKAQTCPPTNFDSMANFDLDGFIVDKWYSMKQVEVIYQPITQFYCVYAQYTKITTKSLWCLIFGCTDPPSITIFNSAKRRSITGSGVQITFSGTVTGDSLSKIKASSRLIPRPLRTGSNYWVITAGKWDTLPNVVNPPISALTYDWAIITSGEPNSIGTDGKCYTNGGMWIFSKLNIPPINAITDIETIATGLGLSTSEWKTVAQEGCQY